MSLVGNDRSLFSNPLQFLLMALVGTSTFGLGTVQQRMSSPPQRTSLQNISPIKVFRERCWLVRVNSWIFLHLTWSTIILAAYCTTRCCNLHWRKCWSCFWSHYFCCCRCICWKLPSPVFPCERSLARAILLVPWIASRSLHSSLTFNEA